MSSIQQVARALCLPIAFGLFLFAAQTSAGLQWRHAGSTYMAAR